MKRQTDRLESAIKQMEANLSRQNADNLAAMNSQHDATLASMSYQHEAMNRQHDAALAAIMRQSEDMSHQLEEKMVALSRQNEDNLAAMIRQSDARLKALSRQFRQHDDA